MYAHFSLEVLTAYIDPLLLYKGIQVLLVDHSKIQNLHYTPPPLIYSK